MRGDHEAERMEVEERLMTLYTHLFQSESKTDPEDLGSQSRFSVPSSKCNPNLSRLATFLAPILSQQCKIIEIVQNLRENRCREVDIH